MTATPPSVSTRCRSTDLFSAVAVTEDFESLEQSLRQSDVDELLAFCGTSYDRVRRAIEATRTNAKVARALYTRQAELAALYGVGATRDPAVGIIWFLATDLIHTHQRALARISREECDDLAAGHAVLFNYVYGPNRLANEWMRSLSFERLESFAQHGYLEGGFHLYVRFRDTTTRERLLDRYWARRQGLAFPGFNVFDAPGR